MSSVGFVQPKYPCAEFNMMTSYQPFEYLQCPIWIYDIESRLEWYAPARFLDDFKDLRTAIQHVTDDDQIRDSRNNSDSMNYFDTNFVMPALTKCAMHITNNINRTRTYT